MDVARSPEKCPKTFIEHFTSRFQAYLFPSSHKSWSSHVVPTASYPDGCDQKHHLASNSQPPFPTIASELSHTHKNGRLEAIISTKQQRRLILSPPNTPMNFYRTGLRNDGRNSTAPPTLQIQPPQLRHHRPRQPMHSNSDGMRLRRSGEKRTGYS